MADKRQVITNKYALYLGDCCKVLPQLPEHSVGFSIFSPPFVSLYSYSDSAEDMGNSDNYGEFFTHFGFLVDKLRVVMKPGRIVAVHCMDLPMHKRDGDEIGLRDFPGDIIRYFENAGFVYHSRHCIWKDPLIAATRTHAIGLAHQQIVKDSSMCRTGIPDYILAFRNAGENPEPISHDYGLTEYHGSRSIPHNLPTSKDQGKNKRSHWIWQQYASPVWMDIRQTKVLPFKAAKDKEDARHICPLQLDTIYRCLTLWSNPGDVVLSPFMGVGSEVYGAVSMGRKGVGVELKPSYFRQAVRNLRYATQKNKVGSNGRIDE